MKIPKHAKKRYLERINPSSQDPDKEIFEEHAQAVLVKEETVDNETVQYSVKDEALYIYNKTRDLMITIVDIDFGFSGTVNLELCRLQLKRVLELKERFEIEENRAAGADVELCRNLEVLDSEISQLEAQIEAVKSSRDRIVTTRIEVSKALEAMRQEYIYEANKIIYSTDFRAVDLLHKSKAG